MQEENLILNLVQSIRGKGKGVENCFFCVLIIPIFHVQITFPLQSEQLLFIIPGLTGI